MCDDIDTSREYTLQKDVILYSGNNGKKEPLSLDDIFGYIGQRNMTSPIIGEFVLYASSNYNTAYGYAQQCIGRGFIHKFRVLNDVLLFEQDVYEEAEEVANCVCPKARGIVVLYGKGFDEYALCSSENYLEYIESHDCSRSEDGWFNILDTLSAADVHQLSLRV